MTSFTLLILPLTLLALYHVTSIEARLVSAPSAALTDSRSPSGPHKRSARALSGMSARRVALANLLRRRRSLEASLRAPSRISSMQDDTLIPGFDKREEYWIWMPAHGYIQMVVDENATQEEPDKGIPNLLRYG